jgi:hypothetical protein
MTQSLSPNYTELLAAVPFQADRPIAREIRYVYFSGGYLGGKAGNPIVATNEDLSGQQGSASAQLQVAPPASAGTRWSDVTSAHAREASRRGDHSHAATLHGIATAQAETEIAMANTVNAVNTTFNLYFGTMAAMRAAAQGSQESGGRALHDWAVQKTGAIGSTAPARSVLYLMIADLSHLERFDLDSRWDFVVTATLSDASGRVIESTQTLDLRTHSGDDTKPPPGYVMLERLPPERSREFEALGSLPFGFLKATLINGAIADLYQRLDALDSPPAD